MPSNKGLWTLPLPPNLAPLQCARALPAASAVAQAAARGATGPAVPPLAFAARAAALCLARGEASGGARAESPGRGGAPRGRGRGASGCTKPAPGPAPSPADVASLPPRADAKEVVPCRECSSAPEPELAALWSYLRGGDPGSGLFPHLQLGLDLR